jgi:GTPase SAR1 family protein
VGEPQAGKTAFVQRYVEGRFTDNYKTTIGVDFALKTVKHPDGSTINLQLWCVTPSPIWPIPSLLPALSSS